MDSLEDPDDNVTVDIDINVQWQTIEVKKNIYIYYILLFKF